MRPSAPAASGRRRNWSRLGKLLLGIATIAALVYLGGGWGDFGGALSQFSPGWVAFAVLVFLLNRLVMTAKWWQLLRLRSRAVGLFRAHCIYQSCSLWGLFMPATVGADALRILCLKREGVQATDSLGSIVMERAVGMLSLLLFIAIAAGMVSRRELLPGAWANLVGFAALGAASVALVLWLSLIPSFPQRLVTPILRRWPDNKATKILLDVHMAYTAFSRPPGRMAVLFVLSFVETILTVAFFWCLLAGLGYSVPLDYLALATTAAFLLSRMPVTPGGLGIFEASLAGTLVFVGVPMVDSVAVALVGRILQIISWLPFWGVYMVMAGPPGEIHHLESDADEVRAA
jgi:uncharacterized protein (TIRG00374 family)